MPHATLSSLGTEVRKFRKNKTLREAAKEIGISPATLMRVESGRVPDVETFGKLCKWMKVDPKVYLGMKTKEVAATGGAGGAKGSPETSHLVISAHFKADRTPNPETVTALANMILFAAKTRQQKPTETHDDT